MSEIDEALITKLEAASAVTAICGTRIYPVKFPQSVTVPAIRINHIGAARVYTLSGAGGYVHDRFQIDSIAKLYKDVVALAKSVRQELEAFKGTVDGVRIDGIFLENQFADWDDAAQLFRIQQDYFIHHDED